MFSLNQLRTFLEVARLGSVREAAETLVVSQPAVSAALSALQREVGTPLVERDGRGLRLTAAGVLIARYARRVFALMDEGKRRACEAAGANTGRLRLAAVTTAAEHLIPEMLRRFQRIEPGVELDLEVGNHERVWDRLAHWEVDLVLAGRPPLEAPFRTVATRVHELVVIARPGYAAGGASLAHATWLTREPGSGTRAAMEEFFGRLGIEPPRLTIGSNGAILACVRAGLGVSLVSRDSVERELGDGLLEIVPTPATPWLRYWHLVTGTDREPSRLVQRFTAFMVEESGFLTRPYRA
jgi:DNA-binding transcriptional LysR family regulator